MAERKVELMQFLMGNAGYHSYDELAEKYKVSSRTIRKDLDVLQSILSEEDVFLERERKFGVRLVAESISAEQKKRILQKVKYHTCYSEDSRINKIISFLFLQDDKFTVNTLAEYLQVSKNTVVRDLEKCEKWFNDQGILFVKNKKAGTMLNCDEYTWRKAILNYTAECFSQADFQKLYQSFQDKNFIVFNIYLNDFINYFLQKCNLLVLKNFIRKYETDFSISFSDESFFKLLIYLSVSVTRIKQERCLDSVFGNGEFVNTENVEWIECNRKLLEESFQIRLSEGEKWGILLTFLGQSRYSLKAEAYFGNVNETELVRLFLEEVKQKLDITFLDESMLLKNLLMHMQPAVHRMRYGIKEINPLTEQIKQNYPQIFSVCRQAGKVYGEKLGIHFNDDEISYMVMHIESAINRNQDAESYFHSVILVCSNGLGTSNMVKSRLLMEFPNILVKNVYSVKDLYKANKKDVELIISTVELYGTYEQPIVYVSPLLNQNDIENIERYIMPVHRNRKRYKDVLVEKIMSIVFQECKVENYARLQKKIESLFNETNDFLNKKWMSSFLTEQTVLIKEQADSWENAVDMAGTLLVEEGKVSRQYINRLKENIKNKDVTVELGNGVAMPHAMYLEEDVFTTAFSLLKLEQPIRFPHFEEPVWLIIILAADKSNSHIDAVNEIASIITDEEALEKLKTAKISKNLYQLIKAYEIKTYGGKNYE